MCLGRSDVAAAVVHKSFTPPCPFAIVLRVDLFGTIGSRTEHGAFARATYAAQL